MSAAARSRRIAVFGGSFDPPHLGHTLLPAYLLARGLADCVLVAPCFAHALGKRLSPFEERVAMVQNAMAHYPRQQVWVSKIEAELAMRDGPDAPPRPSYALHLLQALARRYPNDELRLAIGSDIIETGETVKWHRFDQIQDEFSPIVVPRAGFCPAGQAALPDLQSREIRLRLAKPAAQRDEQEVQWLARALPHTVLARLDARAPLGRVWIVGSGHAAGHVAQHLRCRTPHFEVQELSARAVLRDADDQLRSALLHGRPDLIWLLAKDDASESLCEALAQALARARVAGVAGAPAPSQVVMLHAAGSRQSREALAPWRALGAAAGTLHPICSLRSERSHSRLDTCAWGHEGDVKARAWTAKIIGDSPCLELGELDPDGRRAYHAACALVANHVAVLIASGQSVLERLEVGEREALWAAVSELCTSAVDNLVALGIPDGISGPAARGELAVVRGHVDALSKLDGQAGRLYEQLSERLLGQLGISAGV